MKRLRNILTVILLALGMLLPATVRAENTVDVKEIVFGHIPYSFQTFQYLNLIRAIFMFILPDMALLATSLLVSRNWLMGT